MGYNANARLVYGFKALKEDAAKLDQEGLCNFELGDVGLYYSGDGRVEMYSPVLGVLLGNGYDWEPKQIPEPKVEDYYEVLIKDICKEFNIKYQPCHFYLVASIS